VAAKVHPKTAQKRLVQDRHPTRGKANPVAPDEGGRPGRSRCREEGWPLDSRLRLPKQRNVPEDFLAAVRRNKKANAFFESLNKANRYAIAYRLQTAKKPETKQRRMETILAMLARGEAFH